ncbi:MAG: hypothetical protein JKX71_12860 [Amylibacter sp.]|nr:hypothetical protein [Amylibacter sp.]
MSTIKVNKIMPQSGNTTTLDGNLQFGVGFGLRPAVSRIGTTGQQGFGVGVPSSLPFGFSKMTGSEDITSANYGNYQYSDGSVMVFIPAFYYKITGLGVDIKDVGDYGDEAVANAAGYALHRAFKDGGQNHEGFFVDKYQCSNNAGIASSIKLGLPISTSAAHNPIANLNGITINQHYSAVDGAKTRGAEFFCTSRFIYAALALLSLAHGQAATAATYCAWYDAAGNTNYPKGCNNNALGDSNDGSLSFISDGYSNAAKTGSANNLTKTAHNGQGSGVVDLNGNMLEVSLGLTRPGTTAAEAINDALGTTAFYVAKTSVRMQDFTSGWNSVGDHWGDATHLATLFDATDLSMITNSAGVWQRFGSGTNQVLDSAASGFGNTLTGLGIYKDANAKSAGGTNLFGVDGIYEYWRSNLTVVSGGAWYNGTIAGVWAALLSGYRTSSDGAVGFRSACYSV